MSKVVDWGKRITEVLETMPGTSKELSDKTGLGMTAIQVSIKMLIKQKRCFQAIRHNGSLSHTFVYYEMKHWKRILKKRFSEAKDKQ